MSNTVITIVDVVLNDKFVVEKGTYLSPKIILSPDSVVNGIRISSEETILDYLYIKDKSILSSGTFIPSGSIFKIPTDSLPRIDEFSYVKLFVSSYLLSNNISLVISPLIKSLNLNDNKERIQELEKKVSKLLEETETNEKLHALKIEEIVSASKEQIVGYENRIQQLSSYYKRFQQQSNSKIEQLQKKSEINRNEIEDLILRLSKENLAKEKLELENKDLSYKLEELNKQKNKIMSIDEESKKLIEQERLENSLNAERIQHLEMEIQEKNRTIECILSEKTHFLQQIEQYETEIININVKLAEINEMILLEEETVQTLENQKNSLDEELECVSSSIQDGMEYKSNELNDILENVSLLQEKIFVACSLIEEKEQLISEGKEKVSHFRKVMSDIYENTDFLRQKVLSLEDQLDESMQKTKTLEKQVKILLTEKSSLEDEISSLEEKISTYETKIFESSSTIRELEEKLQFQVEYSENLEIDNIQKDEIIQKYKCENDSLRKEIRRVTKEVISSGISKKAKDEHIKDISEELCIIRKEFEVISAQLREKSSELKKLDFENKSLRDRISELSENCDQLSMQCMELAEENKLEFLEVCEKRKNIEDKYRSLEKQLEEEYVRNAQLTLENQEILQICSGLEAKNKELCKDLSALTNKYDQIEGQNEKSEDTRKFLSDIKSKIRENRETNDKLYEEIRSVSLQRSQILKEIENSESVITSLNLLVNSLLKEKNENQERYSQILVENNSLICKILDLEEREYELRSKLEYASDEVQSYKSLTEFQVSRINSLENSNEFLVRSKNVLTGKLEEISNELGLETSQLQAIQQSSSDRGKLKNVIENLRHTLNHCASNEQEFQQILLEDQILANTMDQIMIKLQDAERNVNKLSKELSEITVEKNVILNKSKYSDAKELDARRKISEMTRELISLEKLSRSYVEDRVKLSSEKEEYLRIIRILSEDNERLRSEILELSIKFNKNSEELVRSIEREYELSNKNRNLQNDLSEKISQTEILTIRYEDLCSKLKQYTKGKIVEDPVDISIAQNIVSVKSAELIEITKVIESIIRGMQSDFSDKTGKESVICELEDAELENINRLKMMKKCLGDIRTELRDISGSNIIRDLNEHFQKMGFSKEECQNISMKLTNLKSWTCEKSIDDISYILSRINGKINQSKENISEFNSCKNDDIHILVEKLSEKSKQYQEEIFRLNNELKVVNSTNTLLLEKINREEIVTDYPKNFVNNLEETIIRLKEDNFQRENEVQEYENKVRMLQNENEILSYKNSTILSEFSELDRKLSTCREECEMLRKSDNTEILNKLNEDFIQLNEEKRLLEHQISTLEESQEEYEEAVLLKISNLVNDLAHKEMSINELNAIRNELSNKNEDLLKQLIEYHNTVESLREELSKLPSFEEYIRIQETIKELTRLVSKKDEELSVLRNSIANKSEKISELSEILEQDKKEIHRIRHDIYHKIAKISGLQEQINSAQCDDYQNSELIESNSSITNLRREVSILCNELTSSREREYSGILMRNKEIVMLISKLKLRDSELSKKGNLLSKNAEKIEQLQIRIENLTQQNQFIRTEFQQTIHNLTQKADDIISGKDSDIEILREELESYREKFAEIIITLENKTKELEILHYKLSTERSERSEEKNSYILNLELLQEKHNSLLRKFKEKEQETQEIISKLKKSKVDVSNLEEEIEVYKAQIGELKCIIEDKSQKLDKLRDIILDEGSKIQELERMGSISNEQINVLNKDLELKNETVEKLKSGIKDVLLKISELENEKKDSQKAIEFLRDRLWGQEEQNNRLKKNNLQVSISLETLKDETNVVRSDLRNLELSEKEYKKAYLEDEQKIGKLNSKINILSTKISGYEKATSELFNSSDLETKCMQKLNKLSLLEQQYLRIMGLFPTYAECLRTLLDEQIQYSSELSEKLEKNKIRFVRRTFDTKKVVEYDNEFLELLSSIQNEESPRISSTQNMNSLEKENRDLTRRVAELESRLRNKTPIQEVRRESNLEEKCNNLKISSNKKDLESVAKISELESKVEDYKRQINLLDSNILKLNKTVGRLEHSLEEKSDELEKSKYACSTLTVDIELLANKLSEWSSVITNNKIQSIEELSRKLSEIPHIQSENEAFRVQLDEYFTELHKLNQILSNVSREATKLKRSNIFDNLVSIISEISKTERLIAERKISNVDAERELYRKKFVVEVTKLHEFLENIPSE